MTLNLDLDDQQILQLRATASRLNVSVDVLAKAAINDLLALPKIKSKQAGNLAREMHELQLRALTQRRDFSLVDEIAKTMIDKPFAEPELRSDKTTAHLLREHALRMCAFAQRLNYSSVDELANAPIDDLIDKPEDEFKQASARVLKKNEELYRRLS